MASTYELVVECVAKAFELGTFTYGPNTDLVFVASQIDQERLEWAMEDLQDKLKLEWPLIPNQDGRLCRARLFVPDSLTVTELCEVVDSGKWPANWTRPGQTLRGG